MTGINAMSNAAEGITKAPCNVIECTGARLHGIEAGLSGIVPSLLHVSIAAFLFGHAYKMIVGKPIFGK